jgi:hypothetical protein
MVLLRMKRGLQWWWLFLHQDFGLAGIKEIRLQQLGFVRVGRGKGRRWWV